MAEAGRFVCSNDVVNRLQDMSRASLLNNFHSIPTDCPHREKQGWTADTYMTDQAAIYNFDMAAFYAKWVEDLAGTQDSAAAVHRRALDRLRPEHLDRLARRDRVRALGLAGLLRRPSGRRAPL